MGPSKKMEGSGNGGRRRRWWCGCRRRRQSGVLSQKMMVWSSKSRRSGVAAGKVVGVKLRRPPWITNTQAPSMASSLQFVPLSGLSSTRSDRTLPNFRVFRYRNSLSVRCSGGEPSSSPSMAAAGSDFDAKAFRHNLMRSDNYNRKGFGHKKEALELMSKEYFSKNFS
ncbi:hypothetical protein OSB04_015799 [Centaurea solstitialis]|uniref:Uncharacterized protein n=1 Tax=Centaurea solstitialis TaxID=347529 RepID=A0AA38T1C2_9ASTR|nr:hypothetical protein OSB04_015799 [Centaurea solstitialis]